MVNQHELAELRALKREFSSIKVIEDKIGRGIDRLQQKHREEFDLGAPTPPTAPRKTDFCGGDNARAFERKKNYLSLPVVILHIVTAIVLGVMVCSAANDMQEGVAFFIVVVLLHGVAIGGLAFFLYAEEYCARGFLVHVAATFFGCMVTAAMTTIAVGGELTPDAIVRVCGLPVLVTAIACMVKAFTNGSKKRHERKAERIYQSEQRKYEKAYKVWSDEFDRYSCEMDKEYKKKERALDESQAELYRQLEEHRQKIAAVSVLHADYKNESDVDSILYYMEHGRADNIMEALNLIDAIRTTVMLDGLRREDEARARAAEARARQEREKHEDKKADRIYEQAKRIADEQTDIAEELKRIRKNQEG